MIAKERREVAARGIGKRSEVQIEVVLFVVFEAFVVLEAPIVVLVEALVVEAKSTKSSEAPKGGRQ